jgi:hypothetical protein
MPFISSLTPEQRAAALDKAREVKQARAQLRRDLKAGTVTFQQLLGRMNDPTVGKMRVKIVLESLPGMGKIGAARTMERCGIPVNRRLQGLGERQLATLREHIR